MKWRCYPDAEQAGIALDLVNGNLRSIAVEHGYELDPTGVILGKTEGVTNPEATGTENWSDVEYLQPNLWGFPDPQDLRPEWADAMLSGVDPGVVYDDAAWA